MGPCINGNYQLPNLNMHLSCSELAHVCEEAFYEQFRSVGNYWTQFNIDHHLQEVQDKTFCIGKSPPLSPDPREGLDAQYPAVVRSFSNSVDPRMFDGAQPTC